MGVGCNLQIPLTPDGTTSIKDYHGPFWPWVLLFPATVKKTAEWHYRTEAIIHETQKHKPAATKWTHRRMRILNDICFGLWAVRANHNETVRHHAYGLTEWFLTRAVFHSVRLVSPQGGPRQWLDHWSNDHESSLGGAGCWWTEVCLEGQIQYSPFICKST